MHTFISMLRGINVSGQKKIKMVDLRTMYELLGFVHVKSYAQSGNIVFDCDDNSVQTVAEKIESQIELSFGYSVSVFLRDRNDFRRIVELNPFFNTIKVDPAKLHVTFLYTRPPESELSALAVPDRETAEFALGEMEIYLFCPDGYGKTRLSNSFFERKLGVQATTRNWRTVNALYNIVDAR